MRRRRHRLHPLGHPLVIALITLALVGGVTLYAFNEGLPFARGFTASALVQNSLNVHSDNPVRIAGVDVGRVLGVEPEGGLTRITFTVQEDGLPLHTDATVRIRDRLFLEGGYYLELDPGTPNAPIAHSGFTIPPANTSYPVQFYQVLSVFNAPVRTSLTSTLATFDQATGPLPGRGTDRAGSGAAGLKNAIPELAPTLRDVAWTTRGLRGLRAGDVQRVLDSSAQVTTTLAQNTAGLTDLVASLYRTTSALASVDGALGETVAGLDSTLRQAPRALTAVDRALPPLSRLSVALDPSLRVAPPLVSGIIGVVQELSSVIAPAPRARLLAALRTTFATFPATVTQLGTLFPVTRRVTDCLRTHVLPVLKSQIDDGPLSSGRPVWQDFTHLLEGLTSSVQNFDGNGYWVRVIGGGGTNGLSLGEVPGLGGVVGSAPSSSSLQGARPHWVGDLTSADFRPDAPCASQPLPSLAAAASAPDLHPTRDAAPATAAQRAQAIRLLGLRGARR